MFGGWKRSGFGLPSALTAMAALLSLAAPVSAKTQLKLEGQFGGEVNATTLGDICPVNPGDTCQGGTSGGGAGFFANPFSVAVFEKLGRVYVADANNQRIDEFDTDGKFIGAWGDGVVASGPDKEDEIQSLTVSASAGEFTLVFKSEKTPEIAYDASASTIQSDLESLASIGAGNVHVTGGPGDGSGASPYSITFVKALEKKAEGPIAVESGPASPLAGGAGATVSAINPGGAVGFEVCDVKTNPTDVCQRGTGGAGAGEMKSPIGVAVDESTGHVYVADRVNFRVQEFGPDGEFVLAIGGEVNSNKTNLCLAKESVECKAGVKGPEYPNPHGSNGQFTLWSTLGNVLTVGGPNDLLYVGDQGRIQEFNALGSWEGEGNLPLASPPFSPGGKVTGLSVDSAGDVYLAESWNVNPNFNEGIEAPAGVYEFNTGNPAALVAEFGTSLHYIGGLALDPSSRVTITNSEVAPVYGLLFRLYTPPTTEVMSEFGTALNPPTGDVGNGFAYDRASGRLYSANSADQDITVFAPVNTPEALTGGASPITNTKATLNGEVDAEEAPETNPPSLKAKSFFEWGICERGPLQSTCAGGAFPNKDVTVPSEEWTDHNVPVQDELTSLIPNQAYHYRLVAENKNGLSIGVEKELTTSSVPPVIEGFPEALFVHGESATLSASLNPENAETEYYFEYGTCQLAAGCASITQTLISAEYGNVEVMQEASGLKPSTTYHFRLVAKNSYGELAVGPEGTFTTGERLIAEAPSSTAGEGEGAGVLPFVTTGLPGVLLPPTPLPQLAQPNIKFPSLGASKGKGGSLTNAQKLARALKACRKKPKRSRAKCVHRARRRYGTKRTAKTKHGRKRK